jgi:transcriptional regulator with XRE-family HTH domain
MRIIENDMEESGVIDTAIGRRFKEIRKKMGLKTYEMAKKLQVSPSAISGIENAKRTPSKNILMALCALDEDVDMDWLILGVSNRDSLKKELLIKEAENRVLQERNMEKEAENLRLLAKINALQTLEAEIEALKVRIAEFEAEKSRAGRVKQPQKAIAAPDTGVISDLQQQMHVLQETLRRAGKQRDRDEREIAKLNAKVQQQTREIRRLKQDIEAKEAALKGLKSEGRIIAPSVTLDSEHDEPAAENSVQTDTNKNKKNRVEAK